MRCPVHHIEGCECAYARRFHSAMLETGETSAACPHFCDCDACLNGTRITLGGRTSPGLCKPVALALTFAGLVVACGPRPDVCSERDAALITTEASCLAQAHDKCAGIPLDEPCPFEDECVNFVKERCK